MTKKIAKKREESQNRYLSSTVMRFLAISRLLCPHNLVYPMIAMDRTKISDHWGRAVHSHGAVDEFAFQERR